MDSPGPTKPQRQSDTSTNMQSSNAENELNSHETNLLLSHSATTPILASSSLPKLRGLHSSPSTPIIRSNSSTLKNSSLNKPLSFESKVGKGSHRLLLETSFTCSPVSSPGPRPDLRNHVNASGLTWEILSALEDQLLSGGAFTQALSEEFLALAPLASPETLSETSSIASRYSFLMREASRKNGQYSTATLQQSTIVALRGSKKFGKGYCFYIDATPPRNQRKEISEKQQDHNLPHSSSEDEDADTQSANSPVSFITLDPIIPKDETITDINHCQDNCTEDPPFNYNYFHLLSEDIIKLQSNDAPKVVENPINSEVTPIITDNVSFPRSISSSSLETEKELSVKMTSSQLSKDSGFGDRAQNTSTSTTTLPAPEFSEGGWVTPQQEYGLISNPPQIPFYMYTGASPQISPSSPKECLSSDNEPESDETSHSTINPHPLHIATPLLHNVGRNTNSPPSESGLSSVTVYATSENIV